MKALLATLCVIGFGLAGCSQGDMSADSALATTSAAAITASAPSDGTTPLATIASHPERYLDQKVLVKGRLMGWHTTPVLVQDGTNAILPLLGNAAHLATLFPRVDDSQQVEIRGMIATNNTSQAAAVGIVPQQLVNI